MTCTCTLLRNILFILGLLAIKPALAQQSQLDKFQKGTLEKGHKVGIWQYYGYTTTGTLTVVQVYDHNTNKLLYFRPVGTTNYNTEVKPGEWRYMQPDQPPLFIGGTEAMLVYMSQLVYSRDAQERMLEGKVVVSFHIDTLGRVSNYRLAKGIGLLCDEEAMRVAKIIPQTWVPAHMGSRAVAVEYELPFTFRLSGH
jgi:protein TonB